MPEGCEKDDQLAMQVTVSELTDGMADGGDVGGSVCLSQGLCLTTSVDLLSDIGAEGRLLVDADGHHVTLVDASVQAESGGQAIALVDTSSMVAAGLDLGQFVTQDDVTFVGATDIGDENAVSLDIQPQVVLSPDQLIPPQITLADGATLQSLLAAHGSAQITGSNGETIQIITVGSIGGGEKMWQLVQNGSIGTEGATVADLATVIKVNENDVGFEQMQDDEALSAEQETVLGAVEAAVASQGAAAVDRILTPVHHQNLPPGCPSWAHRLRDCEQIGDSYRGWVDSEVELDLVLTFHKQQTQTFWGTRQSPSPAKQSTRLMWKSQYVPFDGIPFVNSGSRAIVMECQYGPRRKGNQLKKQTEPVVSSPFSFRQTCPARIYIKKVRKYPEFRVDLNMDKKSLKIAMDKAFQLLKEKSLERWGQERYYVQLPTNAAHEFHTDMAARAAAPKPSGAVRLHPQVAQKIRSMVAAGETRLYAIRKALRRLVEKELFASIDQLPEKHNLSFYPTVNDLQNHIHQAVEDIENGMLPVSAHMVNVEVLPGGALSGTTRTIVPGDSGGEVGEAMWLSDDQPHAETVTVTLTQNPNEDGQHMISRVETHLSDGSTQVSESLTPHTARLLTKLHPNMFPAGSLLQLQDACVASTAALACQDTASLSHRVCLADQTDVAMSHEDDEPMTAPVSAILTSDALAGGATYTLPATFSITENELDSDEMGGDGDGATTHGDAYSDVSCVKLEVDESEVHPVLYDNMADPDSIHTTV